MASQFLTTNASVDAMSLFDDGCFVTGVLQTMHSLDDHHETPNGDGERGGDDMEECALDNEPAHDALRAYGERDDYGEKESDQTDVRPLRNVRKALRLPRGECVLQASCGAMLCREVLVAQLDVPPTLSVVQPREQLTLAHALRASASAVEVGTADRRVHAQTAAAAAPVAGPAAPNE
jgi:hypothetical protein